MLKKLVLSWNKPPIKISEELKTKALTREKIFHLFTARTPNLLVVSIGLLDITVISSILKPTPNKSLIKTCKRASSPKLSNPKKPLIKIRFMFVSCSIFRFDPILSLILSFLWQIYQESPIFC